MTPKEIIEGNELIAKFMGFEIIAHRCYHIESYKYLAHAESGNKPMSYIERLKFHSSWDWLIPVAHKIFDETDEHTTQFAGLSIFELGLPSPIEEIWKSVVEFIVYINKKQPAIASR